MKQEACNTMLLADTAKTTKEDPRLVKQILDFYMGDIAKTIKEGAFETVLVPHFGKFQPKIKQLQYVMHKRGATKQYGTIQNNRDTRSRTEQGMDNVDSGVQSSNHI